MTTTTTTTITLTRRTINYANTLRNMEEWARTMHQYLPEAEKDVPKLLHGGVWATAKEIFRLFEFLSRKGKANTDTFTMQTITASIATKLKRSTRTVRRHIDLLVKLKFLKEKKRASQGIILTLSASLVNYTEKTVTRYSKEAVAAAKRAYGHLAAAVEEGPGFTERLAEAFLAKRRAQRLEKELSAPPF
jgi:hypothetical protein